MRTEPQNQTLEPTSRWPRLKILRPLRILRVYHDLSHVFIALWGLLRFQVQSGRGMVRLQGFWALVAGDPAIPEPAHPRV